MIALRLFSLALCLFAVAGFTQSAMMRTKSSRLVTLRASGSEGEQPRSASQWMRSRVVEAARQASVATATVMAGAAVAGAEEQAAAKKKKVKVLETDSGIPYVVLKKGDGAYPNPGDFVVINYIGFLPDGTVFDDTHEKKALSFRMGQKQVIPGLESVIEMLSAGSEVTTNIPSKFAYGAKGVCTTTGECLIKPNTDLKYFVRLKRVGAGYN